MSIRVLQNSFAHAQEEKDLPILKYGPMSPGRLRLSALLWHDDISSDSISVFLSAALGFLRPKKRVLCSPNS